MQGQSSHLVLHIGFSSFLFSLEICGLVKLGVCTSKILVSCPAPDLSGGHTAGSGLNSQPFSPTTLQKSGELTKRCVVVFYLALFTHPEAT